MIHGMIHKTRGKSFFVLISVSPETHKSYDARFSGSELCGYAISVVKVPVPPARVNRFREGTEMVAPVPDPDYQSEIFQMGIPAT